MGKCLQAGLIQWEDDRVLTDLIKAGNSRQACHDLLTLLYGTSNDGFAKFKAILETWPKLSSIGVLLEKIKKTEERVCGSEVRG